MSVAAAAAYPGKVAGTTNVMDSTTYMKRPRNVPVVSAFGTRHAFSFPPIFGRTGENHVIRHWREIDLTPKKEPRRRSEAGMGAARHQAYGPSLILPGPNFPANTNRRCA